MLGRWTSPLRPWWHATNLCTRTSRRWLTLTRRATSTTYDHRIGESKPWYEALIERCAKALQDIDDMENDYLQDIEVVEAILTQHCGWQVCAADVSAAHAPRLSQSRGQAIERWNGALGEVTLNSTRPPHVYVY